jgi:hypothetical protein
MMAQKMSSEIVCHFQMLTGTVEFIKKQQKNADDECGGKSL